MQAARLATRLQRELRMLQTDPPPGVCAWPCKDSLTLLDAQIRGPDDTVYMKGIFLLEVRVPERYPFEPPNVKFRTPIYHPNIDSGGRICLDILNMPPKGAWKPSLNIPTILASIGLLLAEPNQDDGLMEDITREYKHDRAAFDAKARKWTEKFAVQNRWNDVGQKGPETPPAVDRELLASEPTRIPEGPQGRVQDSSACESEKQASSLKLNNGQRSVNQKSKLSMKLCRGKDVTVLDKEEQPMAVPVPNDASCPDPCVDRGNSNLRIHRQPDESSSRTSSIGMGPRKSNVDERAKPSGASTSTADASAMEGNAARGRGAGPSLSSGIKDADASKEIPHPSDRIASQSARKRPRESEKLTTVSERTPTDTKVVSPRPEEIAAPQSPPPIPQSNTAGDYGGHLGVASSKLSTHRFGSGRLKAESFPLQSSKRPRQHTDAASASCSLAAEPSVFQGIVPDTEEQADADITAKSPGQSQFNFKRLSCADEHREEHTLPPHASERSRDATGKGSSKPVGNELGDRPAGKLSTSSGIPNRHIESLDENVQNRCKNAGKTPRMESEDALEIRPRAEASSKMAEMNSQRASGTGREGHPCVPSIPVSNSNSHEVGPVPASVIESSKTTFPENTKEFKGVENRSEPTKRAADVIVLDSESEEEPPKVVSRLSLARRKGLKRK